MHSDKNEMKIKEKAWKYPQRHSIPLNINQFNKIKIGEFLERGAKSNTDKISSKNLFILTPKRGNLKGFIPAFANKNTHFKSGKFYFPEPDVENPFFINLQKKENGEFDETTFKIRKPDNNEIEIRVHFSDVIIKKLKIVYKKLKKQKLYHKDYTNEKNGMKKRHVMSKVLRNHFESMKLQIPRIYSNVHNKNKQISPNNSKTISEWQLLKHKSLPIKTKLKLTEYEFDIMESAVINTILQFKTAVK